jgi:enoyl-CoA hydratase/carnithine racemase
MYRLTAAEWRPKHFKWEVKERVATITLNRPERKNPLTFDSYAELRDTFHKLQYASDVRVVVFTGEGGNFCSGGDVHEIIGPLLKMPMDELIYFTRMTGNLVKEMRNCPQPVIAAVDGVSAGAGAIIPMSCDMRYGTPECKTAFLFVRVGLAGCDMGACAILPRIIGQGRASELVYTGRSMSAEEGAGVGLLQRARPEGTAARARARDGALARERAVVRARHDQKVPAAGMEHDDRAGARDRGRGAGDLHADPGLPARLRRLRQEGEAEV